MKFIWLAALAFAVSGLVPSSAFAEGGEEDARRQITAARELYASGNWETAKEAYQEAYEAAPDQSIVKAEAALEWSSLLWEQGDYGPAETRARDAMSRAQKLGLDEAVGRLMLTLGHIEASKGQFDDAESTLKICVQSAKEQRDEVFESLCRINLRFVRQLRGRSVPPESQYRRDLKKLERSGKAVLVGTALAKSAELQEKAQDHAGALATLRKAQQQFESAASLPAQSRNKLRLAQTLQNLNRWDEAAKEQDGLVLTFKNMKNRPALVTAYALRGKQRSHEGKTKAALQDLQRARREASALGSPQLVANVELALCEFWATGNETKSAEKHCLAASKGFGSLGIPALAARAHILLARLAQLQEEWLTSRKHYLQALTILENEVAKSALDRREVGVQRVNLCQVEMKLEANGAHQRCREAMKDLETVKATDRSFREMRAATYYAIGMTAPEKQAKEARKALSAAAKEWVALKNGPQAAEAYLRLGKLQTDEDDTKALNSFSAGLDALGQPPKSHYVLALQLGMQKGQIELARKQYASADDTLDQVITRAEEIDDAHSAAWGYSARAQALLKLGKRDEAIESLQKGLKLARKSDDVELREMIEGNLSKLKAK